MYLPSFRTSNYSHRLLSFVTLRCTKVFSDLSSQHTISLHHRHSIGQEINVGRYIKLQSPSRSSHWISSAHTMAPSYLKQSLPAILGLFLVSIRSVGQIKPSDNLFNSFHSAMLLRASLLLQLYLARGHTKDAMCKSCSSEASTSIVSLKLTSLGSDVGRTLTGASYSNSTMTDEQCVAYCDSKGFIYAGTEYSSQCCESWFIANSIHADLDPTSLWGYNCDFRYSSRRYQQLHNALRRKLF